MLAINNAQVNHNELSQPQLPEHNPVRKHVSSHYWSWPNRLSMAGCIMGSAAVLWFLAMQNARIDATNYQIDRLQSQVRHQVAENASLSTTVDELKQPSRILAIALGKLHMKYTTPVQVPISSQQP
ncbi:hypothetical protein D2Q93_03015 [Alicyclobacillaceae bacterium I2511]|nr:hypothetical protein D2Q93_03015 [Alicyclobacillaceae bacterium I2511]